VRWNSPYINHFTQPDSIIPDQTSPQSWDRYSYVQNNPLRYTDPTGHYACGDGEEHDCNGHQQDPTKNPHPPKPPKPPKDSKKDDDNILSDTKNDEGSPLVSIAGILLTVSLGVLDGVLGYGIIVSVAAAPLGLVADLVLVPLEILSVDLTVYAAQMAATGRTDHDPLLVIHGFFPTFLPYKP
jgi:hypothetical protein